MHVNISGKEYKKYAQARAKRSPAVKNVFKAFIVGGAICTFAQALTGIWGYIGVSDSDTAGTLTSVSLIFIAILLTGIGVFDRIARFAGGGTLVPITGFANAMSSPAIDSRAEGAVLGVGAKIFTVAGPVILYGISAGILYGVIYALALALCK